MTTLTQSNGNGVLIKTLREVQKIRNSTPSGRPDSSSSFVYTTLFTDDKLH